MRNITDAIRELINLHGYFGAVLVALSLVMSAQATNYTWTGVTDDNWNVADNWTQMNGTAHAVPSGADNAVFATGDFDSRFTDGGTVVVFDGAMTNKYKLHIRAGSESAPLVFRATSPEYGLTGGSPSSSGNTPGWYIGYDNCTEGWLKLESGTYKTAKYGNWLIGGPSAVGHLIVGNGVTVSCDQQFQLYNGTVEMNGGSITSTGNFFIGYQSGKEAAVVVNGGTIESKLYLCVGNKCSGSLTINNGGLVKNTGNDLPIGDGAPGTVTINPGGKYQSAVSNWGARVGSGAVGTLVINGGSMELTGSGNGTTGNGGALRLCNGNYAATVCITNGGLLAMRNTFHGDNSATATVTLDGGTLKAVCDTTKFITAHNNLTVQVGANGAIFDTDTHTITVEEPLNAAPGTVGGLTVTGGGTATFPATGDISGAFAVGENTTLHWFDIDGVASNYAVTAFSLAPGATLCLDAGDTFTATPTVSATAENKANVFLRIVDGESFPTSFASSDVDKLSFTATNITKGISVAVVADTTGEKIVVKLAAKNLVWAGAAGISASWNGASAWLDGSTPTAFASYDNAIFNTSGAIASVDSAVTASKVVFNEDAAVGGSAALSSLDVFVAAGKTGVISAPTTGKLEKIGPGRLTLENNRTEQTTLTAGTLAMRGATVDGTKLTLGTDVASPVVFDYGGQTLTANPSLYLSSSTDVTLTNGIYTCTQDIGLNDASFPFALTIASDAIFRAPRRLSWNTYGEATLNVVGGTVKAEKTDMLNWIMQASLNGRMNFNVTDGGLMDFANDVYVLTCRDSVGGSTAYKSPSLYWRVVDSTIRVRNNSLRLGRDDATKPSATPVLVFAATNSVLDIANAIYIGNDLTGLATGGSYSADFECCTITAKQISVYQDRPLNAVRFNGTRLVLRSSSEGSLATAVEFETIGAGGTAIKPMTVDVAGLIVDTNGKEGTLAADPQGSGAITKTGAGQLKITRDQTSSAPMLCEAGETYIDEGLTVSRAVTVKSGAKFTVKGTAQSSIDSLSLEAGSELCIDLCTGGIAAMSIGSLSLPVDGTAALTRDVGVFVTGVYKILVKPGITVADVQGVLLPSTGDIPYEWSVDGNTLVLNVGSPTAEFFWTGNAGDGKLSTAGNWYFKEVPGAGDAIDFSSVSAAATVIADIDVVFGAVTMGSGVVTFTNAFAATSFSDTSRIAVDANSTVTLMDDLRFTNRLATTIVYSAAAGGRFVVMGEIELTSSATAEIRPFAVPSDGAIVSTGLVANEGGSDHWIFRLARDAADTSNWIVGTNGLSGTRYFWLNAMTSPRASIQPLDADFDITTIIGVRDGARLTLNTTGDDGLAHVITIGDGTNASPNKGGIVREGNVRIDGSGRVVCCYDAAVLAGSSAHANKFYVRDTATLALKPGTNLGTGLVTVQSNATLEVAESETISLGGPLMLQAGAILGFNFTTNQVPVLDLADTDVSFQSGATTNVSVRISAAKGVRPLSGAKILTSGGKFKDATVTLAGGSSRWVCDLYVNEDGDIVIGVKPRGLVMVVQ